MAVSAQVEAPDGVLQIVRRADAADRARLRLVGERLHVAAHPGVVTVLGSASWRDGWELRVAHGGVPLGSAPPRTPQRLAALTAGAAATLADLHERGIVHGRLDASRLLVSAAGEPTLCGFETGTVAAGEADDVAALGAILLGELDRTAGPSYLALRAVAERAVADPASRRPPARRLAAELAALAGPPVASRRARPRAAIVALLAAGLVGVLGLAGTRGTSVGSRPRPPTAARVTSTSGPTEELRCVAVEGAPIGPPDCGQAITVAGSGVTVEGRRQVVGAPGDLVAVGDWDCDGDPSPASLRPGTGEVLVFATLEPAGAPRVALAQRVPGAVRFAIETDADGCPSLGVEDADGRRRAVGLAADRP